MKIAIIGAGFAGLSCAYFCRELSDVEVTLFDAGGIGSGASGAASGLLHPYPGLAARRSQRAEEALALSKQLIRVAEAHTPKIVASHTGILRAAITEEQSEKLLSHCTQHGDVEQRSDGLFLIHSGITVHSRNYMEGLWNALKQRGVQLILQKIEGLDELSSFDQIVIAAGYGVRAFPECSSLPLKFLKGQALTVEGSPPTSHSFISKGYIAHLGGRAEYEVGSTYERTFSSEEPDLEAAKELLAEKLLPSAQIRSCRAGVRVMRQDHYLPLIEKVADNAHVFTGLGSRGLLYHALFGRQLAHTIAG